MRDTESPLQKLQILQISQNYHKKRYKTPIAEFAHIANIAEFIQVRDTETPSQKAQILQLQNLHRRNRRYCKYRIIIQMRDTEPPSKWQILHL